MVHHYREDEQRPSERAKDDECVKFNCEITPPFHESVVEPPPPTPEPEHEKKQSCCASPVPVPAALATIGASPSSDLVEALPTILVGISVAYAIGMLTGAFIFSPSLE